MTADAGRPDAPVPGYYPTAARALCVSIHDIAPPTWPQCRQLIAALREVGDFPLGLLLVPRWHGQRLDDAASMIAGLQALLDDGVGHEVLLHGLYHFDDARAPTGMFARVQRRVVARGEAEFASLNAAEAMARIRVGLADLNTCGLRGLQVTGFVPPAWMMSRSARAALSVEGRRLGLRYVSLLTGLLDLQEGRLVRAPALIYSVRWRIGDALVRAAVTGVAWCSSGAPLLRLGLHPADMRRPMNLRHAQGVVERALDDRVPCTEGRWLQRSRGKASGLLASKDVES